MNFRCKKCKDEFDCEIGKTAFPNNIDEKLSFEKEIVCPNCGIIKVDEAELTEIGQSDASALYLNEDNEMTMPKFVKSNNKFNMSRIVFFVSSPL